MDGTTYPMTLSSVPTGFHHPAQSRDFLLARCRAPQWLKREPLVVRPWRQRLPPVVEEQWRADPVSGNSADSRMARCQRGIARGREFKCDVLSDCGHVDALTQGPRLIACGTAYSSEQP